MIRLPDLADDHYYLWQEVVAFLSHATKTFPDLCTVTPLGETPQGRPLLMARVAGPGSDPETRPAYLVQANVHAPEVAGTHAALYLIKRLLEGYGSDPHIHTLLTDVTFYIVPRMNPDGAEFILTTGGSIRSRNTDRYRKNGLYQTDVNGDGLLLSMRIEDPCGDMKCHPKDPRLMVPRKADDEGPFYFVYPEGMVHDWDGGRINLAFRSADFNRNWAANWRPEYEQGGAGDFPFSQPEMRALAEFVYDHPGIYGILGFHCGANAVLRPPSTGSDDDLLPEDLRKCKEIGLRGEELTGFKLRAVIDYRLDSQKPISLKGHFHDWGYRHLGLFVYEIELGNLYNSAGYTTEKIFATEGDKRWDFDLAALRWHDEHPQKRAFLDWTPFKHPQLGQVEIGGWRRHFLLTPASEDMATIGPRCALFILDHAGRYPRLELTKVEVTALEASLYRVRATVMNSGDLPTQITALGARVTGNEPVRVALKGAQVLSREEVFELGHLSGVCGARDVEWFVKAEPGSQATLRAWCPKAVAAEATVSF